MIHPTVNCTHCGAQPGEPCSTLDNNGERDRELIRPHKERMRRWSRANEIEKLKEVVKPWWVSCHVQKDGRINLGTAKHRDRSCVSILGRPTYAISGNVTSQIQTCKKCA